MTNALKAGTYLSTQRDPIKEDFRNFLFLVWQHLNLPEPTPVQYDIAKFLQHGPKRLVIEAFRGVGKSWVTSAFVLWLLYCNPQLNILVISASKNRSDDFSTFTLRLIFEMDILAHLRPQDGQRFSKVAFDVGPAQASHAPSVKSLGINSQIAGSRADVLIADDIEVPNNSDTNTKRDKLSEQIKEFDAVLKPGGRIIYLGTPQSEQSIYNILPDRGYIIRVWPARYPTEEFLEYYGATLSPLIRNALEANPDLCETSTDPGRFSDIDLNERELSYGRSGFTLQFMLCTKLSDQDRFPLKLSDLIVLDLNPRKAPADIVWASSPDLSIESLPMVGLSGDRYFRPMYVDKEFVEYEGTVTFVDPAGRGKDETAWATVKMLHGMLFLVDIGAFQGGGYDTPVLDAILDGAKAMGSNLILVEPNFGDGMFAQLLRSRGLLRYPVSVEDSKWSKTQKEARIIDTLEPVMNQHRLVVSPAVIEKDYKSTEGYPVEEVNRMRLFYQMTRISRAKGSLAHDDRLDAVAGAVAHWMDILDRNSSTAAQGHRDDLLQKELDDYASHVLGFASAHPRFY